MSDEQTVGICTLGVLDYERFSGTLVPLVQRAQKSSGAAEAVEELRAFVANIKDRSRRDEAVSQVDRIDVAVQGSRWHRAAAGHVLEAACVEELTKIDDQTESFKLCLDYLYEWNEDAAETIAKFFAFLSDHTLPWASPSDTWRAAVPPEDLVAPAEVMSDLTPRALRKLLESAEDGIVFAEDEAETLAEWWGQLRKMVRLAHRQERGLLVAIKEV